MIRKLQFKITAIMAGVLLAVFAIVFITLNIRMQIATFQKMEDWMKVVASFDGIMSSGEDGAKGNAAEPFVRLNHQNEIIEANLENSYHLTLEELQEITALALGQGKQSGNLEEYQFYIAQKDYGKMIVFTERGATVELLRDLVYNSIIIAGISCVVLLLISILLARWAVLPVKDAFEKQRQFISDASHELKTPLTVIVTNADVLQHEIGENTEITHIREHSNRMSELIHDMLSLARSEEDTQRVLFVEFDLSSAVRNAVLGFESAAFEANKTMTYEIQEGIRYTGNEQQIRQLVSIFVDNAIKHSNAGGDIQVQLKRDGSKIRISFYNTGVGVRDSEKEKIFERFYRSDASRSRETGSYGLGLAIAKSIVRQHGGKISVDGVSGEWVRFTIRL